MKDSSALRVTVISGEVVYCVDRDHADVRQVSQEPRIPRSMTGLLLRNLN